VGDIKTLVNVYIQVIFNEGVVSLIVMRLVWIINSDKIIQTFISMSH